MSNPWMKFYPSDWRADPALRVCSLGARGLWMEMLCLMHEADGYLMVNGKELLPRQLAALSGASVDDVTSWLVELSDAGVFSRNEAGAIYSRRMVKDIAKAAEDKANGRKGGNPKVKGGVNPPDNPPVDGGDKAQKPEARNQKPDSSETKVSSDASPGGLSAENVIVLADPRADLFGKGVKLLMSMTGKPEQNIRRLIGKWLKQSNDDAVRVLREIEDSLRDKRADPVSWIEAALQSKPQQRQETHSERARRLNATWI